MINIAIVTQNGKNRAEKAIPNTAGMYKRFCNMPIL
jgi:hypothetical protein